MCGILAVTGYRKALPLLIEGLEKLEYRGYDSAGIAVIDSDNKKYCFEVKDMLVKEDFIVINGWASDEDLNIGKICVVFKPNNKSE